MDKNLLCKDLCIDYRNIRAVDHLTGCFEIGSMTAIVGPNGGGKTTLLKALKGCIPIASGSIEGPDLKSNQIAYLPQNPDIDRTFPISVREVVAMGLVKRVGFFSQFTEANNEMVRGALRSVGLEDYAEIFRRPLRSDVGT